MRTRIYHKPRHSKGLAATGRPGVFSGILLRPLFAIETEYSWRELNPFVISDSVYMDFSYTQRNLHIHSQYA